MKWPVTSCRAAALAGFTVLLATTVTIGCGRKAPPSPPQIRVAATTRDLSVEQRGSIAVITWSYPSVTSAGGPLPDVEAIEVFRAALPPGQEPTGTTQREIQVKRQLLENQGEIIANLDVDGIAAATRGAKLLFEDDLSAITAKPDTSLVIWYSVRTRCCGDRANEFSNIARLVQTEPPASPSGFAARGSHEGILITWVASAEVQALVERSAEGQTWSSVTSAPVAGGEWLDGSATQGQTWSYRLLGVVINDDDSRLVGEPGPAVSVEHPDVYPPDAPSNLVCLPEQSRVRLRWTQPSNDVRFRVKRTLQGGPTTVISEKLEAVELVDLEPPAGSLTYSVLAVDSAGNTSDEVSCDTVIGAPS